MTPTFLTGFLASLWLLLGLWCGVTRCRPRWWLVATVLGPLSWLIFPSDSRR